MHAVETVGLPEAQIILAQVVAYLSCAPKSNASYMAIAAAMKDVEEEPQKAVPLHLRDTHYKGSKDLGHEGYQYAHNGKDGWVEQEYMPNPKRYYLPTDRGVEAKFREILEKLGKKPA
jgi:putative ATPase